MAPTNVNATNATGGIVRPHPQAPFNPTADQATFRDLLLFEERLKMNAEMLRKRRRRYSGTSSVLPEAELISSIPLDLYWFIGLYGVSVDVDPPSGILGLT